MDTGTHFVIGISLAGLAHIDPVVSQEPLLAQVILLGTVIGSQAPDFDGITRMLGGTANYIKNHRGITHSLPAFFVWPTLISFFLLIFYPTIPFSHLWLWIFISVFLHVFLDLFNPYGTQALRPFSQKWIALNTINIFDPFIFVSHIVGILIWSFEWLDPKILFSLLYLLTIIYLVWRLCFHHNLISTLRQDYKVTGKITILPTIQWTTWNVIEENDETYRIGVIRNDQLEWIDEKKKFKDHQSIIMAKQDKKIEVFLSLTDYAYPMWKKTSFGYEVRFIDLRYRFKNHYPFIGIVLLNEEMQIIDSYIGWVYNQEHLTKKIHSLLNQS
ncbi:metal-dependent hydrolase [Tepidibacillus decaturensis]|uniref:Hydrolase n=1 Tax=Tepidibacillus decaturensis TaxID=1413211 RepID=A0A135L1B1_9BACI|nr:metal-dependent hydrolase [Tepidibacillus decaturensis]KXG42762.1 hypothetical protein U473_00900 [Tepidibacillus decaturensis]